ncbi:MCP four helix bundle domain-containing protein [Massilia sp. PAMC28688]|uniref:methyl-accepting chemotaxis protein n=1 Tax=Massilia sp. PAMC28688 TaxID=2861283 RepID=UPI001C628CE9|nr:methyl-accepting chemotaxis protein [Massilia sp. PAMC28688]QYF94204.1 MCP four helix bundle domain-containing protein [Massilia sp. PAMC28688]
MNQTSIRKRLLLSNIATLLFVAICGFIGFHAVRALNGAMDDIASNGSAIKDQLQADMMHDAIRGDVLGALLGATNGDQAQAQEAAKDFAEHAALLRARLASMDDNTDDAVLKQDMARVLPDAEAYLASAATMIKGAAVDKDAAQAAYPAFLVSFRKLEDSMGELSEHIERNSAAAGVAADSTAGRARLQIIGVSLLSMLVALALAMVNTRAIVRPLDAAIASAARIARGDLSADAGHDQADPGTETGRLLLALSNMRTSLHQIVSQVRVGTDAIATASGQIASGNMDLSSRTEMQAGSLEETASTMEELTATVRQNTENARQATQLAGSASTVATKGGAVVSQVVATMGAIDQASARIGDIIGVIESIAFQTNILALNAAVEAARAGEQGRGFAVVASEVRALAQRSNSAAREIKALVGASAEAVEQGSVLVRDAGATMDDIMASVQRVSAIMQEISVASAEQERGIEQVNQAIGEIDGITQQNAALVEQAAAAAGSMQDQAATLATVVSVFQLDAASRGQPDSPPGLPLALRA